MPAEPLPDAIFAKVAVDRTNPAQDPQPDTMAEFFAGTRVAPTAADAFESMLGFRPNIEVADAWDSVGPTVAAAEGSPVARLAFRPPLMFTRP